MRPKLTYTNVALVEQEPTYRLSQTWLGNRNLILNNRTFYDNEVIYAFGDIKITGYLINSNPYPVIIIASGEIDIDPSVNIIGDFEFKSGQLIPPGFPSRSPIFPMSDVDVSKFCNSPEYKAKGSTAVAEIPIYERQGGTIVPSTAFTVSPNPFTNQVTVDYSISAPTEATLVLSNALGQTLKSISLGAKDEGNYQQIIETADLARGLYLLTLRTEQGIETKKLVKQ